MRVYQLTATEFNMLLARWFEAERTALIAATPSASTGNATADGGPEDA